jgi:hypothetical protein
MQLPLSELPCIKFFLGTDDALSRRDRPTSQTAQREFFGDYLEYTHLMCLLRDGR